MSAIQEAVPYNMDHYLEDEANAEKRYEYLNGQIYVMQDSNSQEQVIIDNVAACLTFGFSQLGCQVYAQDMKLRLVDQQIFYYPDVMLCCTKRDKHEVYKESPCFVAEVMSEKTESIDKREKLLAYQSFDSLQYYLAIDSREKYVEYYYRQQNTWQHTKMNGTGHFILQLNDKETRLSLSTIYAGVEL